MNAFILQDRLSHGLWQRLSRVHAPSFWPLQDSRAKVTEQRVVHIGCHVTLSLAWDRRWSQSWQEGEKMYEYINILIY